MSRPVFSLALAAALAVPALALAQAAPEPVQAAPTTSELVRPPVVDPLPTPDAEGRKPRAVAMLAPYRYDDILWENDRTAHRIYGHALEAAEPPSSSGIDA